MFLRSQRDTGTRTAALRRAAEGTTLIELLVVLAIASIAIALVVPGIRAGRAELQMRDAVRRLAAALNGARSSAIFRGHSIAVRFDESHSRIYVVDVLEKDSREIQLPESIRLQVAGGQFASDPGSPGASFDFQPDGGIPELAVVLTSGSRVRRVRSDPFTGIEVVR